MRIKRFEAPDTKTAIALVKEELGEDAVILANKTIDAGTPAQRIEIVAAMDYDVETITLARKEKDEGDRRRQTAPYGCDGLRRPAVKKTVAAPAHPAGSADPGIRCEARDLRQRFAKLLGSEGETTPSPSPGRASWPGQAKAAARPRPEEVNRWRDQLISQLKITLPRIERSAGSPLVLALTGPTGVGKTTTSAKIAAWYKLRKQCRVALLSMDCYRIGATDQLRTYARIMGLPCEIVLRRKDLDRALQRYRDYDLIIVDTAGKSPYEKEHIRELARWFAGVEALNIQLVLSATTKKEDLHHIMKVYSPLEPDGLILTKLDETRAYATLCQQVAGSAVPVSYLATGQRVPEDFFIASRSFLDTLFKKGWSAVEENRYQLSAIHS